MVMAALLLASAALQPPANGLWLECEIPPRPGRTDAVPMHLSIALAMEGGRIASVLVDGPPLFSSYRITRVRRDSPELGRADPNPRLLPRNMQWRGNLQGHALRLRRERTEMVLEPRGGAERGYRGFWTYLASAVPPVELNGTIDCGPGALPFNESTRS